MKKLPPSQDMPSRINLQWGVGVGTKTISVWAPEPPLCVQTVASKPLHIEGPTSPGASDDRKDNGYGWGFPQRSRAPHLSVWKGDVSGTGKTNCWQQSKLGPLRDSSSPLGPACSLKDRSHWVVFRNVFFSCHARQGSPPSDPEVGACLQYAWQSLRVLSVDKTVTLFFAPDDLFSILTRKDHALFWPLSIHNLSKWSISHHFLLISAFILPYDILPHLPLFSWYSWNLTMWWHVKTQVSKRILIGWCLRGHRWLGTSCFHLLGMEPSEWTWDLPFLEVSGSGLRHTRNTGLGSVFFCLGNGSVQGEVTSTIPCYKSYGARPPVRPLYLVLTEPGWKIMEFSEWSPLALD